jgi:prolyl-tRNA synthetase
MAEPKVADLRKVVAGDPCPAQGAANDPDARITIKRGIEVGHIFQLGTKYSEAMNAVCLDERGDTVVMPMGCYGIGVSRIVAAAIEQNHDDNGIIWPDAIAPFEAVIIPIGTKKSGKVAKTAESLYNLLSGAGMDVMLDDRDERPGVMFAEADLIGIPHRLVVGERGILKGTVEYKPRSASEPQELPIDDVVEALSAMRESIA